MYCLVWDYYMDWGLFRSSATASYALRSQIKFPQWFYYFAMFLNLCLRFYWVIGIFHYTFQNDERNLVNQLEVMAFLSLMAEAVRRSVWSLIRVENEFFNNFEAYRTIPTIPDLLGVSEKIDWARVNAMIKEHNREN